MKIKTLFVLLAFILISGLTFGQAYTFKVLANKGANEVKSGDSWLPLKTGATLKDGDELKLADNAYIGLIHVTGKPLEIKTAGNYKVTVLASQIKGGSSVLSKYTDFILSSNAEGKKNRLSATGAVHRATDNSAIHLLLPDGQNTGIFSNTAVINWEGSTVAGPFVVTVMNLFEEELEKVETPEMTFTLDLSAPKYVKQNALLVEVKSKADPKLASKHYSIKRLSPAEQEKVKKTMDEFIGEVQDQSALNKFIMAGFYEENKLLIDAIAAYEEAIKLAPDVPSYKEAYEDFLLRNGLKK
jgi:hypothetical protein